MDFKRILIDEGFAINIISTTTYKNLNLPFSHICAPYLQLRSFNDALCSTVGSISFPITMGSKRVQILLQVIEGDIMQYKQFLGRPWIRDMQFIPLTYHNYLKYIHDGMVHCVLGDENPYSHCNYAHLLGEMAFTFYSLFYIAYNSKIGVSSRY